FSEANQRMYDENKQQLQEYYNFQRGIFQEQERLMERMEQAEQRYQDAIDRRASSIAGTFGLFAELREREEVQHTQLMGNLDAQVNQMRDWERNIDTLSRRAIDEGLLQQLREMGPSAATEIAALNRMSDVELTKYVNLWREQHEIARRMAVAELQPLRQETAQEIQGLADEVRRLGTQQFVPAGQNIASSTARGIRQGIQEVVAAIKEMCHAAERTAKNMFDMNSPSRLFAGIGIGVGEGFVTGVKSMDGTIKKTIEDTFGDLDNATINPAFTALSSLERNVGSIGKVSSAKDTGPIQIIFNQEWTVEDEIDIDMINRKQAQRLHDTLRGAGFAEI
ncbi:MAG: hypothetical protein FWC91_01955, partial [Defluviitaleaceae bacterium]|nr:hypothetical protein [Defluviitaleaceae bacterium]